jgi:hypothetical protein
MNSCLLRVTEVAIRRNAVEISPSGFIGGFGNRRRGAGCGEAGRALRPDIDNEAEIGKRKPKSRRALTAAAFWNAESTENVVRLASKPHKYRAF